MCNPVCSLKQEMEVDVKIGVCKGFSSVPRPPKLREILGIPLLKQPKPSFSEAANVSNNVSVHNESVIARGSPRGDTMAT